MERAPVSCDYEVDVAVVGGGACGLMTALRTARHPSLRVAVFEKGSRLMSSAEISSGTLAAAGTRFQTAAGIVDAPERHAEDVIQKNHGRCNREVVLALCRAAPRYVEYLADELGHPVELAPDMSRVGHSVPRLHSDKGRTGGTTLVKTLKRGLAASPNVTFVDNTPGTGLIGDSDAVLGLRVLENGEPRAVRARATVLACDGFGANREMVARYCPDMAGAAYIGVEGNTGDAIVWATELGAATDHMTAYLGHGYVAAGYGTRLSPAIPLEGGIVVNHDGRRFVREDQGYSEFARCVLSQPEHRALEVWDERIMRRVENSELMRDSAAAGAYRRFESWEELASACGLPLVVLRETVQEYHRAIRRGVDEFGRSRFGQPLAPSLYAAWITGGLANTQGGLRVDACGRVQRAAGGALRNLYAGGGTAAGISGEGGDGYLSGNGFLAAFSFGYLIGDHLAEHLR